MVVPGAPGVLPLQAQLEQAATANLKQAQANVAAKRARNGTSVPVPGNYELFRGLVATEAPLLSFIDICFCLAVAELICLGCWL